MSLKANLRAESWECTKFVADCNIGGIPHASGKKRFVLGLVKSKSQLESDTYTLFLLFRCDSNQTKTVFPAKIILGFV